MPRFLGLVALIILVLGGGLWILRENWGASAVELAEPAGDSPIREPVRETGEPARGEEQDAETLASEREESEAGAIDERVSLPRAIAGQVHLQPSDARDAARVLFTAGESVTGFGVESHPRKEWERQAQSTRASELEADGSFSIELGEEFTDPVDGILYVASAGHELLWTFVDNAALRVEVSPEQAEPLGIEVRDADGVSTGESVRVIVVYTVSAEDETHGEPSPALSFPVAYPLSENGVASIARSKQQAAIWAVAGTRRSAEWRGSLDQIEHIVLDFDPSFSASGVVEGLETLDPSPSDLRVTAYRADDAGRRRLGTIEVEDSGQWRLTALPTDEMTPVVFRLDGKGIVPKERVFPAPASEDSIEVGFEVSSPQLLVVRVFDPEDHPVEGVSLTILWDDEPRVRSSPITTDQSGVARLEEAPSGEIWAEVEKEGYVAGVFGPFAIRDHDETRLRLTLSRAGRLGGKCILDGKPASTFTLRYWAGSPWHVLEEQVADSADGLFLLEDSPLGMVQIIGMSPDCPPTPVLTVEVKPDADAWIEIELVPPGTASGRVVDSETGSGIAGAQVQVLQSQHDRTIGTWGEPTVTNSLGEFSGVRVIEPLTTLEIRAEGYSTQTIHATAGHGRIFDCGTIELVKSGELLVRLLGTGVEDFSDYAVILESGAAPQRVVCNKDGVASFEGVGPGNTAITVSPPRQSTIYLNTYLEEGDRWVVEVPVVRDSEVVVEIINESGHPLPDEIWVGMAFAEKGELDSQFFELVDEEGKAIFRCVPPGEVYIDVLDNEYKTMAYRRANLDPSGTTVVPVEIRDSVYRLRFFDTERKPIAAASVSCQFPGQLSLSSVQVVTDDEGIAELSGFDPGRISVSIARADAFAWHIPVDLTDNGGEPVDVIVSFDAGFECLVHDDRVPLEGLTVHLRTQTAGPTLDTALTSPSGLIEFEGLTPRAYIVDVRAPGYWPTSMEVEASLDRPRFEFPVRRVGTLSLQCTQAGLPTPSTTIDLDFAEWGQSASSWLAEGLIRTSTGTLTADVSGKLVIQGLPRGEYRWVASHPSGGSGSGKLVVTSLEPPELSIELH